MADLVVSVSQGKLRGKTALDYKGGEYYSFQGIPYAKPPVGNLRFKAPVPPESWAAERDATKEASASLSKHMVYFHNIGSEDCLYLNVFTPQLPDTSKCSLPVMVWIHGGAFTAGSGNEELYGPQYFMTQNVVLVTINYRLGILGFLSLEDASLGISGNAGLKDMVQALKWIQKNICNFNGDSNNVTIFGESAGGCSAHYLVLSPKTKGLFHRAILQSGSTLNPWAIGRKSAVEVAQKLGYSGSNTDKDILAFLLSVPQERFIEAQEKIEDPIDAANVRPYGPIIEKPSVDAFITEHPIDIILSGNYNKVPLIIGYTSREGMLMEIIQKKDFGKVQLPTDFQMKIPAYYNIPRDTELSKTIAKIIKEYYYGSSAPSLDNIDSFYLLETDILFWRGIYMAIKGHLVTSSSPIYVYRMSVESELNLYKKIGGITLPGACHADDIGYLFKTVLSQPLQPGSVEANTVHRMIKLWTTFAHNGDPNPVEKDPLINVKWSPAKLGLLESLEIGENLTFGPNPDLDRMDVWNQISEFRAKNSKL